MTVAAPAMQKKSALAVEMQAAIQRETVQGDLKGAIGMYERILARGAGEKALLAEALLRLGQCHEKLGTAGARKAYERLVREFGDQKSAAEARARLTALGGAIGDRIVYESGDISGSRPSRDGRLVAALCGGAVCVIDSATGASTMAVAAPKDNKARHWRPLVSPDGQWMAYTHFADEASEGKGDLRLARVGGGEDRILLQGSRDSHDYFSAVDWTADGQSILVAKTDRNSSGLVMVSVRGGEPRKIEAPEFNWNAGRDRSKLSPDGKWLAYPAFGREKRGGGEVPTDVRVISLSGGSAQTVFGGESTEKVVGWTGDEELLVVSDRDGKRRIYRLRVVNGKVEGEPLVVNEPAGEADVVGVGMTTGTLFLLAQDRRTELIAFREGTSETRKFPLGYEGQYPTFSKDGRQLAYAVAPLNGPSFLVVRDVATGQDRRLPPPLPRIQSIVWYPDGKRIHVICNLGNWGRRPSFQVDLESGESRPGPEIVDMSAYWTPTILNDGKSLVYTGRDGRPEDAAPGMLQRLDLQSGEVRPLLTIRGVGAFSISRDRRRIAYQQVNMATRETSFWISDIDNPQPKRVLVDTNSDQRPGLPIFSPDERSIYFWRVGKRTGLWKIPAEGGAETLVREMKFSPSGPAFHPVTGEIIVGVDSFVSRLRIAPLR